MTYLLGRAAPAATLLAPATAPQPLQRQPLGDQGEWLAHGGRHFQHDGWLLLQFGDLRWRDGKPAAGADPLQTLQQRHVRQSADRTGYGLGLSIVATIAAKHDAQLQLTSPLAGEAGGFEARLLLTPR